MSDEINLSKMREYLASPEFAELAKKQQEASAAYAVECDTFWDNLPYEDKLMAFYAVIKRTCQAELKDEGTYRWAIYDVFGFDFDAYAIGMECGYMELHNRIMSKEQYEEYMASLRNKDGSIQI